VSRFAEELLGSLDNATQDALVYDETETEVTHRFDVVHASRTPTSFAAWVREVDGGPRVGRLRVTVTDEPEETS
jgi:hypothetical protein